MLTVNELCYLLWPQSTYGSSPCKNHVVQTKMSSPEKSLHLKQCKHEKTKSGDRP